MKFIFPSFPSWKVPGSPAVMPLHLCCASCAETTIQAHRYLYHVAGLPMLPDVVYDKVAALARQMCQPTSKVHCPGSLYSTAEDYTEEERAAAHKMLF